jgi:hypothetical protein
MADRRMIELLTRDLLDALEVDWVSIPAMTWFAARVAKGSDDHARRELVIQALLDLLDDPRVKVVSFDMSRNFDSAAELSRHLNETWPEGKPPEVETGWLVEQDFELRQPDGQPD